MSHAFTPAVIMHVNTKAVVHIIRVHDACSIFSFDGSTECVLSSALCATKMGSLNEIDLHNLVTSEYCIVCAPC